MRQIFLISLCLLSLQFSWSQENSSPYKTDFWKDGAWIAGGVGLNVLGFSLVQNKDELTTAELMALNRNDISKINRGAVGNYSKSADEASYIPFYASFASPALLLLGDAERENFGQISVMFVETMTTTGAFFTITAGLVDKSRPLVYNENLPEEQRTEASAQRSFFAGRTAATAAATFFTAKVFQDFNPDSKAVPFVWAGAIAVPATVGYLRTKAGKHFLTDNVVGFGVGALCGILVPEIHKIGNQDLAFYPSIENNIGGTGVDAAGVGMNFRF